MIQDDFGNDIVETYGWEVIIFAYYEQGNYNDDGYPCDFYD